MPPRDIVLANLAETERFGIHLGSLALPGDVICLDGDLGAGKTTLTKAIALGLDVVPRGCVTSPSFAIVHEYSGRIPLYHMDFYRLGDMSEVEDLGFDEYFYMNGVTVIEWSLKATGLLPVERLSLCLQIADDDKRIIECTYVAQSWKDRLFGLALP